MERPFSRACTRPLADEEGKALAKELEGLAEDAQPPLYKPAPVGEYRGDGSSRHRTA
jgi:hypothetical protein